jgi:exodeoxyribonuclease-1
MQPLLHVSGRYPAMRGCLAMVAPIAEHPDRAGTFIVADLGVDPSSWMQLESGDLIERLFTRRADLPKNVEYPPLKQVHRNKSPFLAPPSVLQGVDTTRITLDVEACMRNLETLRACDGLRERVRHAFASRADAWPERTDPECMLYAGFPSPGDKRRCEAVRSTPPAQLRATGSTFDDPRYAELLFRYRARNWPDTLDAAERDSWREFVRTKLTLETETTAITLQDYRSTIERLRVENAPGPSQVLLDQLQAWGDTIAIEFGL